LVEGVNELVSEVVEGRHDLTIQAHRIPLEPSLGWRSCLRWPTR
jgi:hypothetical protein